MYNDNSTEINSFYFLCVALIYTILYEIFHLLQLIDSLNRLSIGYIFELPTMCTPYYQSRLNLVSEICLVYILTFSA